MLVADWAVAVVLAGSAVGAWRWSRPTSGLVGLTAIAWILGGLFGAAALWHRAVLVHLLLASPGWRAKSRPVGALVAATYALCFAAPVVLGSEVANTAHAVLVLVAAAYRRRGAAGRARHHRRTALAAAAVLAVAVATGSALRALTAEEDLGTLALLVYETGVVASVLLVVSGLRPPPAAALTDLVIDLGDTRSGTLREALARILRDPDLRLGFWEPSEDAYVDEAGRRLRDGADEGRTTLLLGPDARPLAMLQVDSELAADPQVTASIRMAADIIALNAERQQELVLQARELEASRRRLLAVADEERRRLESRLRGGVLRRLERLTDELRTLGPGHASPHLDRAVEHVAGTAEDLAEVAAGLRPRELAGGLAEAIVALGERVPCETTVDVDPAACGGLPTEIELVAWYVCAEALTNTGKHAPGAHAQVAVTRSARSLHVRVADDGPGGAELHERGGLVGLRDRVASSGGLLRISGDGSGTVLEVELPLDREAP